MNYGSGWGWLGASGPGKEGLRSLHGGASSPNLPDAVRDIREYGEMHERRQQTNPWPAYAGSRLVGKDRRKCQPSSRTAENRSYGMIGGIEETSASCEALSAPRSYPTAGGEEK